VAERINKIVQRFLKDKKTEYNEYKQIEDSVKRIVGARLKKHIRFIRVYKKSLVIYTGSSAYSYEVNLKKKDILEKAQQLIPEITKVSIRIKSA